MKRATRALLVTMASLALLTPTATATGVGGATWTPGDSTTTASPSRFLTSGDSLTIRTDTVWDREQSDGLAAYIDSGLRYTHELNDRSGRLSANGFWATNLPDPAFDRDDDDGDRRWEEAEVIAGPTPPEPGRRYTTLVQYSRWHGKRAQGTCQWAWDRRRGEVEVLSQLSRDAFGEWQAERFTLTYDSVAYPRVDVGPALPAGTPRARCRDADPGTNQDGYVVTFARPLSWSRMAGLISAGSAKWTAFEAVGSHPQDKRTWTCGGPYDDDLRLGPCRTLGVDVEGMTAAVGYLDPIAADQLRSSAAVVAVEGLRDSLTGLLFEIGGLGVERPGLTINDRYWELVLTEDG
ncbi:MAG: hypothetical protein AB1Z67_09355 [Candidatus Limnocylindrales bacterium]